MRLVRPAGTMLPVQKGFPAVWLDHGPFSFGSWETRELTQGCILDKSFTGSGNQAKWSLFSPVPGTLICRVPGSDAQVIELKSGINEVAASASGKRAVLEIISAPPGAGAVFDRQRNYSRSRCNNAVLPGEWVVRLTAEPAEKTK